MVISTADDISMEIRRSGEAEARDVEDIPVKSSGLYHIVEIMDIF